MKIAFVYDTVYPWVTGGAERRVYEVAKRLADMGEDVHIYSLGFWMNTAEYKDMKTIEYDGIKHHSVGDAMDLYTKDNKRSIKEAIHFAKSLLSVNFSGFDIVDVQGFPYFSCYSTKLRHKDANIVITLHEIWNDYWYEYMGKLGFFGKIIEKGIMHLTDNFICVSNSTYENMLQIRNPPNTSIIENGVNFNQITNVESSCDESDIIYAGRLIAEKHVDLLIHAVARIKQTKDDIKCFIVGEGPVKDDLIKLADELGVAGNITFKGFCEDQNELYSLIKSSKVFALPSTREGFGIVLIEANCCGIPTVTIDSPMNAAKDLIDDSNGVVVADDADEFATALVDIIENKPYSRENCLKFAKNYDWNNIASKTLTYYENIIK